MADNAIRTLMIEAARLHWQRRARCVVLDTDFQQGQNFIGLWQAFRKDPARCERLHVMAMLPAALTRGQLLGTNQPAQTSPLRLLLADAWPGLTPGLHMLSFDSGQVQLLLCNGSAERNLSEWVAQVDVFFVHGHSAADSPRLAKALARLAADDAVLVAAAMPTVMPTVMPAVIATGEQEAPANSPASAFKTALASQGFVAEKTDSNADTFTARFAPRFSPKRAAARVHQKPSTTRHAVIVGAGLAGSSAAWALAQQGWTSTVLERHGGAAEGASGNAGGLFHGVIHAQDGIHARFNRAASMEVAKAVREAVACHGVAGSADGLLRLEPSLSPSAMQAVLDACGLPTSYARAVDAATASELSGLPLTQAAWHYAEGGWVQPAGLVRSYLARAGSRSRLRTQIAVEALQRSAHGWQLLDAQGVLIEEAEVVVLANATDAARLLGPLSPDTLASLQKVRGQISQLPSDTAGLPSTRMPLTGAGYLLPSWQGHTLFGATSMVGDVDPGVRERDHIENLAQLARLTQQPAVLDIANCAGHPVFQGRTAWRCVAPDRLPVIGGAPQALDLRIDQPRLIARWPGLFVYSALGSRGITWSALGGQTLAAWVTGSPSPIGASLLDAVDPARFAARRARGLNKKIA